MALLHYCADMISHLSLLTHPCQVLSFSAICVTIIKRPSLAMVLKKSSSYKLDSFSIVTCGWGQTQIKGIIVHTSAQVIFTFKNVCLIYFTNYVTPCIGINIHKYKCMHNSPSWPLLKRRTLFKIFYFSKILWLW